MLFYMFFFVVLINFMKGYKFPNWITTPLGIAAVIGFSLFMIEFLILHEISYLIRINNPFSFSINTWNVIDSLIMTFLIIPFLYFLILKMHNREINAQNIISESEKRFRSVVEQSLVGVGMIQNGMVTYANQTLVELLGFTNDEDLIGTPILSLVTHKDKIAMTEIKEKRDKGEIGQFHYQCALKRTDGEIIEIEVNSVMVLQNNIPTTIAVIRDITEKIQAEKAIALHLIEQEKAFMSAVKVAIDLTELRDPYTHGHAARVGKLAAEIGAEMGLDEIMQKGLEVAGNLHDLGKIGIPLEVLCSTEKLTHKEWDIIRKHPQIGYDILVDIRLPWPVAEVALQHHERLDGTGYPQGLKEHDILLESKIVTVADVIDSMTHARPYRPGLGIHQALAEIEQGSGTIYDEEVALACFRLFSKKGYNL